MKSGAALVFAIIIALLVGLAAGYVGGSWRSVTPSGGKAPEIYGMGTELIDRPTATDGAAFNLTSVFAFTKDFFHCVVLTNEKEFGFKTYKMGTVTIPQNQFFMSVDSVTIKDAKRKGNRVEM